MIHSFSERMKQLGAQPVSAAAVAAHTEHFRREVLPRIQAQQKAKAQGAHDLARKVLF